VNFYNQWILPSILDMIMRRRELQKFRAAALAPAKGRVIEIGIGSGLNLPFYGKEVEFLIGVDPSARSLAIARHRIAAAGRKAALLQGSANALPCEDNSADTVVVTWTLCSIADPLTALREVRRVLKPDGRMLFVEHGLSPECHVRRWQRRLTPVWRKIAGGCHLDRKMDDLIRSAGFDLSELRTVYANGPRPMSFMYSGCALARAH